MRPATTRFTIRPLRDMVERQIEQHDHVGSRPASIVVRRDVEQLLPDRRPTMH